MTGTVDFDALSADYRSRWHTYEHLAQKVKGLLEELLDRRGIQYQLVQARAKEVDRFVEKAQRKEYSDPLNQIYDMAGVRVIVYSESDRVPVKELIESTFAVDPDHSIDKAAELGVDRVGYLALHFVCRLTSSRAGLEDWSEFVDMPFEIQVTTVLMHAGAEIEHDRNYRLGHHLDPKLDRRFKLLAGYLEVADSALDDLISDVEAYESGVAGDVAKDELDIPITSPALRAYARDRFPEWTNAGLRMTFQSPQSEKTAFDFLKAFEIDSLRDLEGALETLEKNTGCRVQDLDSRLAQGIQGHADLYWFVFVILMVLDARRLATQAFEKVLGHPFPIQLPRNLQRIFADCGVNVQELREEGLMKE